MRPLFLFLALLVSGVKADALSVTAAAARPVVCSNGNADTINVAASGGAAPYSYTLSPAGVQVGSYFAVAPTVTTTYTVQVTDNVGAVATTTVTLTVNQAPVATVTPAGPVLGCAGSCANLSANIGPGLLYQWYTAAGVGVLGGTGTVYCAPAGGSYYVAVTNAINGCKQNSALVQIVSNPLPTAAISGNVVVCQGGCTTLTITATPNSNLTYNYTPGGTNIIVNTGGAGVYMLSVCPTVTTTYSLVSITNPVTGCTNSSLNSATVTVGIVPTVSITPGGNVNMCEGQVLQANTNFGVTYQWYINGTSPAAAIAGATAPSYVPAINGSYYVNTTSGVGCGAIAGPTVVTLTASPTVTTTSPLYTCYGMNTPLNCTATGGISYLWNGPNGYTSTNQNNTLLNVTNAQAGTYTVTVTGANGCTRSVTTQLVLNPTITSAIVPSGTFSFCNNSCFNMSGVPGAVSYIWYRNGTPIAGATGTNYCATQSGSYTLALTNGYGCSSTSPPTVLTATAIPTVTATNSGPACVGGVLGVNGSCTPAGALFTWAGPNGFTSTNTNNNISNVTLNATGTYTVIATLNGCSDTATTSAVVNALPVVSASITMSGCDGGVDGLLADGAMDYNWVPATGLDCNNCISPVASPSATTTYTVTGTDGNGCSDTASVTVNENMIWGNVYFNNITPDTTDVKVWLITYDPNTNLLTAVDSTVSCQQNGIPYYEFDNEPPLQYMTKAKLLYGNNPGSNGYIPTYYSNTLYWSTASHITHTNTNDGTNDITMQYGTVPAGPGFIGGNVLSGANKHTTGSAPVDGMMVYLKDNNGSIISYTYTDGNGNYSFSNIANGTYEIYPEELNYLTTPWPEIVVDNIEWAAINFKKNTSEMTITPYLQNDGVKNVNTQTLEIYPNPVDADICLTAGTTNGNCHLLISDMSGKEVWSGNVKLSNGKGNAHIGDVPAGVYMATVMVNGVRYVGKVVK